MQKKAITGYGGPYTDAVAKTDAETELDSDDGNLVLETVAQGSFTSPATVGNFSTTADAAPATVDPANVSHSSHWGNADGTKPTVSKTATGRYTVTFPASWTNGLSNSETISLFEGNVWARSVDPVDDVYARVIAISTNVVTVVTQSPRGTDADTGNNSTSRFIVGWCFYR